MGIAAGCGAPADVTNVTAKWCIGICHAAPRGAIVLLHAARRAFIASHRPWRAPLDASLTAYRAGLVNGSTGAGGARDEESSRYRARRQRPRRRPHPSRRALGRTSRYTVNQCGPMNQTILEPSASPAESALAGLLPCPFCGGAAVRERHPRCGDIVRIACGSEACRVTPRTEYLLTLLRRRAAGGVERSPGNARRGPGPRMTTSCPAGHDRHPSWTRSWLDRVPPGQPLALQCARAPQAMDARPA